MLDRVGRAENRIECTMAGVAGGARKAFVAYKFLQKFGRMLFPTEHRHILYRTLLSPYVT
jgi:hypothetical protein